MKKLGFILFFSFLANNYVESDQIITNFDVARWYIDADVVLICTVDQIDTIMVDNYDSISADSVHISYKMIREKYLISVDSIIKNVLSKNIEFETVITPEFSVNYSKTKNLRGDFLHCTSAGDSVFVQEMIYYPDMFTGRNYFRMQTEEKYITMIKYSNKELVTLYSGEVGENIFEIINKVREQGEDYFRLVKHNNE